MTDTMPDLSQPSKPFPWRIILPVAIILVLICICLGIAVLIAYLGTLGKGPLSSLATDTPTATLTSSPTLTSTRTPTRSPTPSRTPTATRGASESGLTGDWDISFDWTCSSDYSTAVLTFNSDFTFSFEGSVVGSWYQSGDYVEFTFYMEPHSQYIGTLDSSGIYMDGTMSNDSEASGCWYGIKTSASTPEASIVGEWEVSFSWDCTGSYSSGNIIFYEDNTFNVNDDSSLWGTWYTSGESVDFTFNEPPNSHYIGTMDSSGAYMEGTMENTSSMSGCWYATR